MQTFAVVGQESQRKFFDKQCWLISFATMRDYIIVEDSSWLFGHLLGLLIWWRLLRFAFSADMQQTVGLLAVVQVRMSLQPYERIMIFVKGLFRIHMLLRWKVGRYHDGCC